ncbi:MAG: hypothetical protein IID51_14660, partial [Proteobacteria bacterium]|nr:hypothetical protein [Pseudomonadota bacterium]
MFTAIYTAEGIEQGLSGAALDTFVANAIATLEANRTLQYHALHVDFGGEGDAFDADFTYTLTTSEETALTGSIKVWTEEELINTISAGLLKAVSDTQVTIEDANIIANNITLVVSGNVGS